MTETLAYLAGIIDGEGHLGIWRDRRKNGRFSYHPVVVVNMCQPEAVNLLHQTFGGGVTLQRPKDTPRPQLRWVAAGPRAVLCARQLLPYLRVKPAQANLLIQLGDLLAISERVRRGIRSQRRPAFLSEQMEALFVAAKRLNAVGQAAVDRDLANLL